MNMVDKPLADKGLISYRYRGRYGWVMIGAKNDQDALNEAKRSIGETPDISKLQVWKDGKYIFVI